MATIFQYSLVTYKCNCGVWKPLPYLCFCRNCFEMRCEECGSQEIDILFCPRCLEVSTVPDARVKKNRCSNCYNCPICDSWLHAKSQNDHFYLSCQNCRWTTREAGIEDDKSKKFPVYENNESEFLNSVIHHMKKIELIEITPKDLKNRKSKGWSAINLKDKYSIQKMVEKRKSLLKPEIDAFSPYKPSEPPTRKNFIEEADSNELRTMDQLIKQPCSNPDKPLYPVKASLEGRFALRCKKCERTLLKREFGAAAYKQKISSFGREYVPDIRLSRKVELIAGSASNVFISISNLTTSTLNITLTPMESNDEVVKCVFQPLDICIPSQKDTSSTNVPDDSSIIVFRQHNRIGLKFEVHVDDISKKAFLGLNIDYTQNGSFEMQSDSSLPIRGRETILKTSVKIALN